MPKAYEQGDPDQPIEECFLCHALTGKAGAGEDSIYTDSGDHGPFCGDCWSLIGEDMNKALIGLSQAKGLMNRAIRVAEGFREKSNSAPVEGKEKDE